MNEYIYYQRVNKLLTNNENEDDRIQSAYEYIRNKFATFSRHSDYLYRYSVHFRSSYFHKVPYLEMQRYRFDSYYFQYKYIQLSKLEYCYRILNYIKNHIDELFFISPSEHVSIDLYINFFIDRIFTLDLKSNIFLYDYERERIDKIKDECLNLRILILRKKKELLTLYLSIFYKGVESRKITCFGMIKEIYSYL